jgi:hypothetical protein
MLARFNHLRRLRDREYFIEFGRREIFKTFSYMTTHFLRSFENLFCQRKKGGWGRAERRAGVKLNSQLGELQKAV